MEEVAEWGTAYDLKVRMFVGLMDLGSKVADYVQVVVTLALARYRRSWLWN